MGRKVERERRKGKRQQKKEWEIIVKLVRSALNKMISCIV